MSVYELLFLVLLGLAVWLWLDSIRAREIGLRAAAAGCADEGLQLLDETVTIESLRLARDAEGRLRLARTYAFEYSDTGDNRRTGRVAMIGHGVEWLHLRPHLYVVPPPQHLE